MTKIYLILLSLFTGIMMHAQGIQRNDADDHPKDTNGNQYSFSNETAYIFNTSKQKNVQILGKNYYATPSITKQNSVGNVVWKKIIIPTKGIWIYQLLLAKDNYIYVAGTLKGNISMAKKDRKYVQLKANENSDDGNPFLLKFDKDGNLIWAVLLANDKDSYRILDDPVIRFRKKENQLTVKTALRYGGGEDFPYMLKTFTVDALTGKVLEIDEKNF